MREFRTYGSEGGREGQPSRSTRQQQLRPRAGNHPAHAHALQAVGELSPSPVLGPPLRLPSGKILTTVQRHRSQPASPR